MIQIRRWAYMIWREVNDVPLVTQPKDGGKLEELIQAHSEQIAALAWWLYVNANQPVYQLEPVMLYEERVSKAGKKYTFSYEDKSSVTKFPLSSFLKVAAGYIVEAEAILDSPKEKAKWEERNKPLSRLIVGPWYRM